MSMKSGLYRFFCCFVLTIISGWLAGCASDGAGDVGRRAHVSGAEVPARVLAAIGADPANSITDADVAAALAGYPNAEVRELQEKALKALVADRVFASEARAAGLDKSPPVIQELSDAVDDALARAYVDEYIDDEALPDEQQVKDYYDGHPDEFEVPDSVRAREVQVSTREAGQVFLEGLKQGQSFALLAEKGSGNGLDSQGLGHQVGHMGGRQQAEDGQWFHRGQLDPEVEQTLFSLHVNDGAVVEHKDGTCHVYQMLEAKPKYRLSLSESRKGIRRVIFEKNRLALREEHFRNAGVVKSPGTPGELARIGDVVITEHELGDRFKNIPESARAGAIDHWLDDMIARKVFSQAARKAGLEQVPEVSRRVRLASDSVLSSAFYRDYVKGSVTEEQVQNYYSANMEKFFIPVRLRIRSIRVSTEAEANAIAVELQKGAAFDDLAKKNSIDTISASKGGEIGWFVKGEQDPSLESVAFSMKKGEISPVIKTASGYEIIELEERKGGRQRSFDEVKKEIANFLRREHIEAEYKRYYEKAQVKLFDLPPGE